MPIPGTRNPTRLAKNVAAAAAAAAADVTLTPADLDRVHEVLPRGAFGSRYPAAYMPQW